MFVRALRVVESDRWEHIRVSVADAAFGGWRMGQGDQKPL